MTQAGEARRAKPAPGGRTRTGGCKSTFEVERVDGSLVTIKCQSPGGALSCKVAHLSTVIVRLDKDRFFSQRWSWTDGVKGTRTTA